MRCILYQAKLEEEINSEGSISCFFALSEKELFDPRSPKLAYSSKLNDFYKNCPLKIGDHVAIEDTNFLIVKKYYHYGDDALIMWLYPDGRCTHRVPAEKVLK